jgi:hypothetical protein
MNLTSGYRDVRSRSDVDGLCYAFIDACEKI